jgi:hypothetical protein
MKRRAPAIIAALVSLGVAWMAYGHHQATKKQVREKAAQKDAEFAAEKENEAEEPEETDKSPEDLLSGRAAPLPPGSGKFHLMPDGSPVPGLPTSAPEKVKLGIALFKYEGSQGASDSTRSREAAQALAKEALEIAKSDFAAAVKKGDRGSNENIGWIQQRILERSVEYAVFSLDKGDVAPEPVDTPRGFWVVKRIR